MRPSPSAQSVLARAHTILSFGSKPSGSRRVMGMVGAVVLMGATALAPLNEAQAQNYRGLLDNPSISADQYGRNEALRATDASLAEVVMVRPVEIRNTGRVGVGAFVGGAVGGAAARRVKDRDARRVATALLGGLGAVAGQSVQNRMSGTQGVQITLVERDSRGRARLINIVQAAGQSIGPGDLVMIEGSGSRRRVVPLDPRLQDSLRASPRSAARPR